MIRTRFDGEASTLLAALLIGLCAGVGTWAAGSVYLGAERTAGRIEVQAALQQTHTLLVRQLQSAGRKASRLASSPAIQSAVVRRDAEELGRISGRESDVGFVLRNGRVIGARGITGARVSVGIFGRGAYLGRVIVVTSPTDRLLATARRGHSGTRLVYTVSDRVIAASPREDRHAGHAFSLPTNSITGSLVLNSSGQQAARVYALHRAPSIALRRLWPWVFAFVASALAAVSFRRHERRRANESPPTTVREAVALVGETLAATHNPTALLPVILRAAIRATGATGGVILSGQKTVASQGTVEARTGTEIRIPLVVTESELPAVLALFPPEGGFSGEALDAANLISDQAGIALENARLHSLVKRQAITDELTGLPNRRQFLAQLKLEVGRAQRSGTTLALILADLDDFKHVNDTWGHAVGDQALRSFAATLRAAIREIDLPARLGGEEFAVLLPDTDITGGTELAERIRHLLDHSAQETTAGPTRVTASFGVSSFPPIGTADELLIDADKSLYQAKQRGKNTVVASQIAGSQTGSIDDHPPRLR